MFQTGKGTLLPLSKLGTTPIAGDGATSYLRARRSTKGGGSSWKQFEAWIKDMSHRRWAQRIMLIRISNHGYGSAGRPGCDREFETTPRWRYFCGKCRKNHDVLKGPGCHVWTPQTRDRKG